MLGRSLNFTTLAALALLSAGCADEVFDVNLDCPSLATGSGCSSPSVKGSIILDTSKLQAGQEYVIVVKSDLRPTSFQSLSHGLSIMTERPSADLTSAEKQIYDRVQARQKQGGLPAANIDESIRPASGNFELPSQNIGDGEFYIPHPGDYISRLDSKTVPFYVHNPSGGRLTGRRAQFEEYATQPGNYTLWFDPSLPRSNLSTDPFRVYADSLHQCLQGVIPQTLNWLGRPLDLDGRAEMNLLLTRFEGTLGARTLGLFSGIDRFSTYGGQPLEDSNYGENIYLAPIMDAGRSCSTTAHELQHMISFDAKVLSRLPPESRQDMKVKVDRGIYPEEYGLDEAYSHMIEELTEERQTVASHIYNFWISPNLATFALEAAYSDYYGNSRSRGLNKMLLDYVLNRKNGKLNARDPITKETLKTLITSDKIGFQNLANLLGISEQQLLQDFFTHLIMSLYDPSVASRLTPPMEIAQRGTEAVSRGIQILNRSEPESKIPFRPPVLHPQQFELKPVTASDDLVIPAQGLVFYRYIVPSTQDGDPKIKITARGQPITAYLIHTR